MKNQRVVNFDIHIREMCVKGNHIKLKQAIDNGFDINDRGTYSYNALIYAVDYGHINCVKTLIENGADPNIQGVDGLTPLYCAARKSNDNFVKLLIKAGANVNLTTFNETPFSRAVSKNLSKNVWALYKAGADWYQYSISPPIQLENVFDKILRYESAVATTIVFKRLGFPRFLAGLIGKYVFLAE